MNKILGVTIVALILIMLFQKDGCTYIKDKQPEVVTVHDTTWQVHDSLIIKKLVIKNTIHDTLPPEYIADTNYPKLKAQYDSLVIAYLTKNIYADTVKLDTLGYIAVADTVHKNEIYNRSYRYSYKIPTVSVTTTITKYAPAKSALFIGGGITGTTADVNSLHTGFLYKSKKDKIFGVNVGVTGNSQIVYGVQSYWKIKLK
jgi:hypothetical protein